MGKTIKQISSAILNFSVHFIRNGSIELMVCDNRFLFSMRKADGF
jgi:hypothetical protein